jgi:hypothetical protein
VHNHGPAVPPALILLALVLTFVLALVLRQMY